MPPDPQLSDLQLAVMRILWDRVEATAAEVHAELSAHRDLAPTTVATLVSRLEKRGVVTHRVEGRQYVYRALIDEGEVRRSMMSRMTDLFFGGSPTALVSHLVDGGDISPEDLAELRRLVSALESREGSDG